MSVIVSALKGPRRGRGRGEGVRRFRNLKLKPATHLAILYADRRDRRKSPGLPCAAIAIFADRRDWRIKSRYLACQISAIKFAAGAIIRDGDRKRGVHASPCVVPKSYF